MIKCIVRYLLNCISICLLLLSLQSSAQLGNKIFVKSFKDISVAQFVNEMEPKFECFFYFDNKDIDSIHLSINEGSYTLTELLQRTLVPNGLQFAIDQFQHVFVSKKYQVQIELAAGYFDKRNAVSTELNQQILLPDLNKNDKKSLNVSIEQKLFEIGNKSNYSEKGDAVLVGYIRDYKNGDRKSVV